MKTYALTVVAVPLEDLHKCKFPASAYRLGTEVSMLDSELWLFAASEAMCKAKLVFDLGGINLGTVH